MSNGETRKLSRTTYVFIWLFVGFFICLGVFIVSIKNGDDNERPSPVRPTRTAQEIAEAIVEDEVRGDVVDVRVTDFGVTAQYMMEDVTLSVDATGREMVRLACALRERFPEHRMIFDARVTVVDALGNESVRSGVSATLDSETVTGINCANADIIDIDAIAESFAVDPVLR